MTAPFIASGLTVVRIRGDGKTIATIGSCRITVFHGHFESNQVTVHGVSYSTCGELLPDLALAVALVVLARSYCRSRVRASGGGEDQSGRADDAARSTEKGDLM